MHGACRTLDDATYSTLSSLALFNNVEIVNALARDHAFLRQLFLSLEAANSNTPEWADLIAFLQEFCNLARHMQQISRQHLFQRMIHLGLFEQVGGAVMVAASCTCLAL